MNLYMVFRLNLLPYLVSDYTFIQNDILNIVYIYKHIHFWCLASEMGYVSNNLGNVPFF